MRVPKIPEIRDHLTQKLWDRYMARLVGLETLDMERFRPATVFSRSTASPLMISNTSSMKRWSSWCIQLAQVVLVEFFILAPKDLLHGVDI